MTLESWLSPAGPTRSPDGTTVIKEEKSDEEGIYQCSLKSSYMHDMEDQSDVGIGSDDKEFLLRHRRAIKYWLRLACTTMWVRRVNLRFVLRPIILRTAYPTTLY